MVIPSLQNKGGQKKQARGKKAAMLHTSKVVEDKGFVYTRFNNIFVDMVKLQQAMISFYKLPQEGTYNSCLMNLLYKQLNTKLLYFGL